MANLNATTNESPYPTLITFWNFFKAMGVRDTRKSQLKRLSIQLGRFVLIGVGCSAILAAAQISALGLSAAADRFGSWWFIVPAGVALFPLAFLVFIAAIEICVFVFVFLLYVLPATLFGERVLKIAFTVLVLGFFVLMIWGIGSDAATERIGGSPNASVAVPSNEPSSSFDLFAWLPTNLFMVALGGLLVKFSESLGLEWLRRKLFSPAPSAPPRTVPIYGPNHQVVSRVCVEEDPSDAGRIS